MEPSAVQPSANGLAGPNPFGSIQFSQHKLCRPYILIQLSNSYRTDGLLKRVSQRLKIMIIKYY